MLSRKYYRIIAKIIRDNTLKDSNKMLGEVNKALLISELCTAFKRDNNMFSTSKFVDACDVVDN